MRSNERKILLAQMVIRLCSAAVLKRVLPAALAFIALCLPAAAEQIDGVEQTGASDSALDFSREYVFATIDSAELIHSLPMLTLLDGRRFPVSGAMGQMGMAPVGLFPASAYLSPVRVRNAETPRISNNDAAAEVASLRAPEYYYGGEVGVFYGRSTGKYGGEEYGGYAIGTVGNDKFQITAGASYQESNFRFPRDRVWSNR